MELNGTRFAVQIVMSKLNEFWTLTTFTVEDFAAGENKNRRLMVNNSTINRLRAFLTLMLSNNMME